MSTLSSDSDDGAQHTATTPLTGQSPEGGYPAHLIAVVMWQVCPPCLLLLGGFGNIATIAIMRRIKDHNSSQHAILTALAVSDLTLLVSAMPLYWAWYVFEVSIVNGHAALCKLRYFFTYASSAASGWLVTCVTVQRTMAVLWPHRMRVLCTVRRTWAVIFALVLSACALNSHFLIGFEITEVGCYAMPGLYRDFYALVFTWTDLCMASLLPSFCMIVCDVILSVSLFKALSSSSSIAARAESGVSSAHSADSKRKKTSYRTTVMVLTLSCAFLVLTLPICVVIVWYHQNYAAIEADPHTYAIAELLDAVTQFLWLTNSAINFVLYCLTGTKFRGEFLRWVRCGARSAPAPAPALQEAASEPARQQGHSPPPK